MSSRSSNPMDHDGVRTRCVILVSPGESPPQPLVDLIRDQTHDARHIVKADHPLLALAHLATLERARRMRKATLEDWPPRTPEKSILVVVNREAWRDLSPLFTTIRQLMPAAGIWVCTERIAIEIYAGDASQPASELDEPMSDEDLTESSNQENSTDVDTVELTDEEIRDLLDYYDVFDPDDDPPHSDAGGSDAP